MDTKENSSIYKSNLENKGVFRSRKVQGLSIVASVLLPIAAAYVVFYTGLGIPSETINQGELIQPPIKISDLTVTRNEEEIPLLKGSSPKWRYLILSGSACEQECEKLLYTSRQVHIRLGEKASRVERLLVISETLSLDEQEKLKKEHPRLKVLQMNDSSLHHLQELTAHSSVDEVKALLIDQEGFAMMAYDNHHSGNQLLKDIKRLLKYSYEN
ncbi:hypothetical protein ACCI51_02500 [Microbulbifer echini]|uniref:Transmembrane protein n=1 Tax=Microbulbifer echini TaxID=1529067 RepID=A0ABV4NIZ6_9GAMM|nr:hypothetical protein [uncultured Microbulbifer sp.]